MIIFGRDYSDEPSKRRMEIQLRLDYLIDTRIHTHSKEIQELHRILRTMDTYLLEKL